MGIFRLYLALAVLNVHYTFWDCRYFPFAFSAVCAFFIVSGFYISAVLNGKYQDAIPTFYLNRVLRIYPICLIVLILAVVGDYSGLLVYVPGINDPNNFFMPYVEHTLWNRVLAIFNSIAIFPGVLWHAFFGYSKSDPAITWSLHGHLNTVGIELLFYAIAPLLVLWRGLPFAVVFTFATIAHVLPLAFGLPEFPWQYEYFPSVIFFFILGRIAHSLYLRIQDWNYPCWLGWAWLPIIVLYVNLNWTALTQHLTNTPEPLGFYAIVTIAVPFLFLASQSIEVDRFIGDLSYPVYACQFLIIALFEGFEIVDKMERHRWTLAAILLFSVALVVFVDHPVDRLRQRIARTKARCSERPDLH